MGPASRGPASTGGGPASTGASHRERRNRRRRRRRSSRRSRDQNHAPHLSCRCRRSSASRPPLRRCTPQTRRRIPKAERTKRGRRTVGRSASPPVYRDLHPAQAESESMRNIHTTATSSCGGCETNKRERGAPRREHPASIGVVRRLQLAAFGVEATAILKSAVLLFVSVPFGVRATLWLAGATGPTAVSMNAFVAVP